MTPNELLSKLKNRAPLNRSIPPEEYTLQLAEANLREQMPYVPIAQIVEMFDRDGLHGRPDAALACAAYLVALRDYERAANNFLWDERKWSAERRRKIREMQRPKREIGAGFTSDKGRSSTLEPR